MMKRLLGVALAAALLSGCGTMPPSPALPAPAVVGDRTSADETIRRSAEVAYKALRTLGEIAVDAGTLKGERATRVAAIDRRAYQLLGVIRRADGTVNAATLTAAADELAGLVEQATAIVKEHRP